MEPKGNVDGAVKLFQNYLRQGVKFAEPTPRVQRVHSRGLKRERIQALKLKAFHGKDKLVCRDGKWELLPP
jgi:hypothetical protein